MNPWCGNAAGYGKAQNRVRNVNKGQARPGQARTMKCYNCNGTGHIARNCGPNNAFDDDVDEQPVQDLALCKIHVKYRSFHSIRAESPYDTKWAKMAQGKNGLPKVHLRPAPPYGVYIPSPCLGEG
nr:hypothetical protein [Tanacetum cinerariifolium]